MPSGERSVASRFFDQGDVLFGEGADAVHVAGSDRLFLDEC